jgi:ribose/xylose/arabinose/galactoside ABC-type transport system permease subunit
MAANTAIRRRSGEVQATLRRALRIPELGVGAAVVAAFVLFTLLDRSLAGPRGLATILTRSSSIGFGVLGMSVLMLAGEMDLSVGVAAMYATVVFTNLAGQGWPEAPSLLGALLVMLLIGWLNSVLVLEVGLPSFLATLCTNYILGGLLWLIPFDWFGGGIQVSFAWLGTSSPLAGVPWIFLVFGAVVLLGDVLVRRTRFGAVVCATGANRQAAESVGIDTSRVKMLCFMFASVCGGLASFAFTATVGTPLVEDLSFFWVIAIAIIGGCSLGGGVGSLLGGLLGTVLLMVIRSGLGAAHFGGNEQSVMVSGILIAAILLEAARRNAKKF